MVPISTHLPSQSSNWLPIEHQHNDNDGYGVRLADNGGDHNGTLEEPSQRFFHALGNLTQIPWYGWPYAVCIICTILAIVIVLATVLAL